MPPQDQMIETGAAQPALVRVPAWRRLTRRLTGPLRRRLIGRRAGGLVRETGDFRQRQHHGVPGAHRYTLRSSGRTVLIRHHLADAFLLDEVFGAHPAYEPPPVLMASLSEVPLQIADIGANIGLFGLFALDRFPNSTVTGYEPDPLNADLHEGTMIDNGLSDRWKLRRVFAATAPASVRFASGRAGLSHAIAPGQAAEAAAAEIEVEAIDVFGELAIVDVIKIDIEGAEWELLADPRFAELRPRALVLEYHGRGSPGPSPATEVERLLGEAGFEVVAHVRRVPPQPQLGWGTVWARPAGSDA